MPITIYTLDGTGSPSATLPNGPGNKSGGFPASVATNLVAADPVTWQWYPVEYKPGFRFPQDVPLYELFGNSNPERGSGRRGINMVCDHILSNPNYFVISGLSQGAWLSDLIYEELRNPAGRLHSKYPYLLGVITFGSPRRPHGYTLTNHLLNASGFSTADIIDPIGRGACGDELYPTSFGTVPGIMQAPPTNGEVQWFCNLDDAASDTHGYVHTDVEEAVAAIARLLFGGTFASALQLTTQLVQIPVGLNVSQFNNLKTVIKQWMPFVSGAFGGENEGPNLTNPHATYNVEYTALAGNSLSAVQLATNYLLKLGAQYATGPTAPIPKDSYSWWQTPPS